ncbi:hypothetical protein NDU88_004929 [Pleurodeles waltl]|uniref:Uncharacterized protein n=1 Tax=Pleurodeles waltl TaxID=8319 RepID=A0AAV7WZ92_PLEWA|nr:hypothetical protein NDU88_004929 [Pleurodeles waltl]
MFEVRRGCSKRLKIDQQLGGHGGLRRGRSSLDASRAVPGGVARTHIDRLDVLPGRSRRGIPAVVETGEGERLRHWGRAALELRRVRRGSARIPLRGNPGRASIGKAPEKVSQEPDSVTTRYSSKFTSKVVGVAGARGAYRQGDKSSPPPQNSVNALEVGGLGLRGGEKDIDVGGRQGKSKSKTDQANHLFKKKKEGSKGRLKNKHGLAPSLRTYFKVRPEDIVLVPGQGKMDSHTIKYTRNSADPGVGAESHPPP